MKRSLRGLLVFGIGILLVLVPFMFGTVRAITTGTDFRYLWIAAATFFIAFLVMALGRVRGVSVRGVLTLFVGALVMATLAGVGAGVLAGARSALPIFIVAFGFALCDAGGLALTDLSRMRILGADWRAPQ
jgi:hypothetical protein